MSEKKIRSLTVNEKIYFCAEEICPPFAMNFIIQGQGNYDESTIKNTLAVLMENLPVLRLKKNRNHWETGAIAPKLYYYEKEFDAGWNDQIYKNPLFSADGCCFELHLFNESNSTFVFKIPHSRTDGIGALHIIKRFFKLLEGQEISKVESYPTEKETIQKLRKKIKKKLLKFDNKWNTLTAKGEKIDLLKFHNEVIELSYIPENIIGKVIAVYNELLNNDSLFLIPVNLKRHGVNVHSVSNQTSPIFLTSSVNRSAEEIQQDLVRKLDEKEELFYSISDPFIQQVPQKLLSIYFKKRMKKSSASGRFPLSGFVSDLGNVSLRELSTTHFSASKITALPVYFPLVPFSVQIIKYNSRATISFTMPSGGDAMTIRKKLVDCFTIEEEIRTT